MPSEHGERKLAAILAADVVGYSRLSAADEEGTVRRLKSLRSTLIDPAVATYRGRVFKTMGDGFLIEFPSVVDAVRAFLQVQRGVAGPNTALPSEQRLEFRVGVHIGDVLVQPDGDLLGDGVNLAARLESIAEPGGLCLSEDAYRQVRDRLDEEFVDLGDKDLKNIARPMRVYAIKIGPSTPAPDRVPPRKPLAGAKTKPQPRGTGPHAAAAARTGQPGQAAALKLPMQIRVRAPGQRVRVATVQQAIRLIDRNVPKELVSLPRWTFARALLVEAMRTGKSRDLNAAVRQFTQALRNERWLDDADQPQGSASVK